MSWRYGIVKHSVEGSESEPYYTLEEIYEGRGHTTELSIYGDTPEEVIESLEMALRDCKKYPVHEGK